MNNASSDIILMLQKAILPLQGYKPNLLRSATDAGLGTIKNAFPNSAFPQGAIHEFISLQKEDSAATGGFVSSILSFLMKDGGTAVWVGRGLSIFPPALKAFGIDPDKIIFIDLKKEKDLLWVMEEALKCDCLAAVIGEIGELSFTASRRLQLAVEKSAVTGFVLRNNPRNVQTTACVTRWKISALPGMLPGAMPGVGFPRWNVELQKVRNGHPGTWKVTYINGRLQHDTEAIVIHKTAHRKTG